jgi:hypothetical protein
MKHGYAELHASADALSDPAIEFQDLLGESYDPAPPGMPNEALHIAIPFLLVDASLALKATLARALANAMWIEVSLRAERDQLE